MKIYRVAALIERDMRKFLRSPAQMMASMVFPLLHSSCWATPLAATSKASPSRSSIRIALRNPAQVQRNDRRNCQWARKHSRSANYNSLPDAIDDLKAGFVRGVISIPHDFSRRVYQRDRPQIALVEDNTDQFISSELLERIQQMVDQMNSPAVASHPGRAGATETSWKCIPTSSTSNICWPARLLSRIFVVAMIGGGITFIDDKSRGLHEGYLVTPISKAELVLGLIGAGTIKGIMAGMALIITGA